MAGPPKPMSIQTTSLFLADNHKQIVGRNIGSAHWHLRMLEFAALHGIRKLKMLTKSGRNLGFWLCFYLAVFIICRSLSVRCCCGDVPIEAGE